MQTLTDNFQLRKYDQGDNPGAPALNANWDDIDELLAEAAAGQAVLQTAGFLTLAVEGDLPASKRLQGTANQVVLTVNAGDLVLSLPQDVHTGATPRFERMALGAAATTTTALRVSSIVSPAGAGAFGISVDSVLNPAGVLNTAAGIYSAPTITGPGGGLEVAASIYADTPSFSGTPAGIVANLYVGFLPSGGTLNYSAFIAGDTTIDGPLTFFTDNTYDLGAGGAAPRDVYAGRQFVGAAGSAAAPSWTVGGEATGAYLIAAGVLSFSIAGSNVFDFGSSYLWIKSATAEIDLGLAGDARIHRDAAAVIAIKNGTAAQTLRVYGTTTGPKYVSLSHSGTTGFIGTNDAARLELGTSGTPYWLISQSMTGGFEPNGDNAYDLGASGAKIRSFYWGTSALGPAGTYAAAAISFGSGNNIGFTRSTSATRGLDVTDGFQAYVRFNDGSQASFGIVVGPTSHIGWNSVALVQATDAAPDVLLFRDAAAVLALRNGTAAQTLRIYGTTTGPKYVAHGHDGSNATYVITGGGNHNFSNSIVVSFANAGSEVVTFVDNTDATAGNRAALQLRTGASSNLWQVFARGGEMFFGVSGVADYWKVSSSGHFLAPTDNTYDIGASGATRPRTGYFGTALALGTNPASVGIIRIPNGQIIRSRNNDNNADLAMMACQTVNSVKDVMVLNEGGVGVVARARSGGAAPTTSDLAAGEWCVWRDTGGATTKIYYNNAGAIIASAAFA